MTTDKIRKTFLDFFKNKKHKIVASDSLVSNDPTLLFTSAGMNQFKDMFMGKNLDYTRASSCQKCLRTGDLENVGQTPRHHTFFEMLGNFSFGDYFKKEAINWAWEYLTQILNLNKDKLWVSVYKKDDLAYETWLDIKGLSKEKIIKLGEKENFWPSNVQKKGPNGPCGPCSEIFFDQGLDVGCGRKDCSPICNCERYVEIWNLVFTQYNRTDNGKLEPLPQKNIDTGMGLERIAAVCQGVKSNFEIDIFQPIVNKIQDLTKVTDCKSKTEIYAIADHLRAAVFAIADGIAPSSDERGYIIRKLISKALRHGRNLNIQEYFLSELVVLIVKTMGDAYPELRKKQKEIEKIIEKEEKKRDIKIQTKRNKNKLYVDINRNKERVANISWHIKENKLSGSNIFELYDSLGVPIEIIIEEIAKPNCLDIDMEGFENLMEQQKNRSRKTSKIKDSIFVFGNYDLSKLPETQFIGYEKSQSESKVVALIKNDKFTDQAKKGDYVYIILDKTPFYPETGGQVSDTGNICNKNLNAKVEKVKKEDNFIIHEALIEKGAIKISDFITSKIDINRRKNIARNHTATHLLHSALRKTLGTHVRQSGSLVDHERLRFDFSHFEAINIQQLKEIELLVNKKIIENLKLNSFMLKKHEAKEKEIIAFFKDKYQENVRAIEIPDFSKELCSGTHVENTGEIGIFKIIKESSIASGIRRIEAVTAQKAYEFIEHNENMLYKLSELLKSDKDDLYIAVKDKLEMIKKLNNKIISLNEKFWKNQIIELLNKAVKFKDVKIIVCKLDSVNMKDLGKFQDLVINNHDSVITVISTIYNNKALIVSGVSKNISKRYSASDIIKRLSVFIKGSGGGKNTFAQAGGEDISGLETILQKGQDLIKSYIKEKMNETDKS